MHAVTALGCAAVLGLVLAPSQEPQGKVVPGPTPMPRLADVLKGYVGQECRVSFGDNSTWISFDPAASYPDKRKLEMVGQDFVKLSGETLVPFSFVSRIVVGKP